MSEHGAATIDATAPDEPAGSSLPGGRGPLDGVRVLDFTTVMSGPYCTRLLADLGAEVLKVEPPGGDHKRLVPPVRDGYSTTFAQVNCGKKSIVLDLKAAAGRRAALDLSRQCDVIVENWRPGVAARLGLDYRSLSRDRDDVIYCAISGFGQTGPNALKPAYAPIVHASSGFELAQMAYQAGADRPAASGIFIADIFAGMSGFAAINAALYQKKVTGRGQLIDVALYDGMLNMLVFEFHQAQFHPVPRRIYPPLRTRDGYVVVAPVTQRNFHALATCIGHPEWIDDPRFNSPGARVKNWEELMALTEAWTMQHGSLDCEERMMRHEVPCSRYRTVAETLTDPHLIQRGAFTTIRDGAGDLSIPTAPYQMPDTNARPRTKVPDLGADTGKVLRDLLGYDEAEIAACRPTDSADHHD